MTFLKYEQKAYTICKWLYNNDTEVVSLDGVEIAIDRVMTKDNKHRVVNAVCRVANGSQWRSIVAVIGISADQRPTGHRNVETP